MFGSTTLGHFLLGGTRGRELRETRRAWEEAQRLFGQSRLADHTEAIVERGVKVAEAAAERAGSRPADRTFTALVIAAEDLLCFEGLLPVEPQWQAIETDLAIAVEFRKTLARRRRWATATDRMDQVFERTLVLPFAQMIRQLPEACFIEEPEGDEGSFEVPLIELLAQPAELLDSLVLAPFTDECISLDLFGELRSYLHDRLLSASGIPLEQGPTVHHSKYVLPSRNPKRTLGDLVETYLGDCPLAGLLETPAPFHIPEAARFEHCHVVGGTGHGKTQLLQRMIHADLLRAREEKRSVVVIDSQGDLINKLSRLALFGPTEDDNLSERLILIDPADVEHPPALNLFDARLDRLKDYSPADRERVLNGVIELYETFFSSLLGAELTQKQGVVFKYLARLMLAIPGATIYTLMQLMEDGRPFKRHMEGLEGSARYFFETEFFHPSFASTKKQILRRLWGVLSTPAFERMFAQPSNKLDLFEALNDGKIILVSTAKDLLKQEGSQLFGRFFVSMLSQATLERSTIPEDERTPTMVYVDEAQEVFDDSVEVILNQARKYKVGITLAHQALDQLTPRMRATLHANTSMKCVGGVSARDARAFAEELHTTSDFIEGMKRRKDRTEFAVWLKHLTPHAIRMTVPLGFLEAQPLAIEEDYGLLLCQNQRRYCGTLADVAHPFTRQPADGSGEIATGQPDDAKPDARRATVEDAETGRRPAPSTAPAGPTDHEAGPLPPKGAREAPPEPGKGGPQHRYLQELIRGLAVERGFRAVIEEAVPGGLVDVGLHRDDVSIACEISVTSSADYEAQNLAKCLRAGFSRVWGIAPDHKRKRAVEARTKERLGEEADKIEFLTPEDLVFLLDQLATPDPEETVVRGYKVKVSRRAVSPEEAAARRAAVARVLARPR